MKNASAVTMLVASLMFPVCAAGVGQTRPRLVSHGRTFFMTWLEQGNGETNIATAVVNQDGAASDATSTWPTSDVYAYPRVATNGQIDLLVWSDNGAKPRIWGRRFQTNGTPIDAAPFIIRDGGTFAGSVASDGDRFLVVWPEFRAIVGAFVSAEGSVTPIASPLATEINPGNLLANPELAWNGREFLLVWDGYLYNGCSAARLCGPGPDARAARLSRDGVRIDATPLVLANDVTSTHVASDGNGFLVVVTPYRGGRHVPLLGRYVHVQQDSLVADAPIPIFEWLVDFTDGVSFDGTDFVVAFRYAFGLQSWLGSAHVMANQTVVNRRFLSVSPTDVPLETPGIASNPPGATLIALSESTGDGAIRIRTYFDSELLPSLAPLSAPIITSAIFTRRTVALSWTASASAQGYQIEASDANGVFYTVAFVTNVTSAIVGSSFDVVAVRVTAFGAAGVSAPSATANVAASPRRRTVSH